MTFLPDGINSLKVIERLTDSRAGTEKVTVDILTMNNSLEGTIHLLYHRYDQGWKLDTIGSPEDQWSRLWQVRVHPDSDALLRKIDAGLEVIPPEYRIETFEVVLAGRRITEHILVSHAQHPQPAPVIQQLQFPRHYDTTAAGRRCKKLLDVYRWNMESTSAVTSPNHATTELTGSARHGLCDNPADPLAQAAPCSAGSSSCFSLGEHQHNTTNDMNEQQGNKIIELLEGISAHLERIADGLYGYGEYKQDSAWARLNVIDDILKEIASRGRDDFSD